MKINKSLVVCICMLTFGSALTPIFAQDKPEKKWNYLAELYLLFPNMQGDLGIGNNLTVPVDANQGDIFGVLKLGGMVYLEAQTAKWAITSDFVFMNLGEDITPTSIINSGEVGMDQFMWEAAGLYRINSFLEVGAGGRLNGLGMDLSGERNAFPNTTETFSESSSKTFYDPIIITRLSAVRNKWLFQFRGDLGGFGVGSDFTWQLQANVGYKFSKLFQMRAGYRVLAMDYDKGENQERFIYDMNMFGPEIRFGFNF